MLSILEHFDETAEIPNLKIDIPAPPMLGSAEYDRDIKDVCYCIENPVNDEEFNLITHDDASYGFLRYCSKNSIPVNIGELKRHISNVDSVVSLLKKKYKRPRPKYQIEGMISQEAFSKIPDMNSHGYPSGHAAIAYFISSVLSEIFPDHTLEFEKIAGKIAQSRLDLGVHYSSDVSRGRYIGEQCSSMIHQIGEIARAKDIRKKVTKKFRKISDQFNEKYSGNLGRYVNELASFIVRSNEIERYPVSYRDALEASRDFLAGYPIDYCTDNKYIRSHLSALSEAVLSSLRRASDICVIHGKLGGDVLERGHPGQFRNFSHAAKSGTIYPEPDRLGACLDWWINNEWDSPWDAHAAYEKIHPFCDGNGRSGRVLLAKMCDFDLSVVNDLIGGDYIPRIVDYANSHRNSQYIDNI